MSRSGTCLTTYAPDLVLYHVHYTSSTIHYTTILYYHHVTIRRSSETMTRGGGHVDQRSSTSSWSDLRPLIIET